jgi:hypothetical protein
LLFDIPDIDYFCESAYVFCRRQLALPLKRFECGIWVKMRSDERFVVPDDNDHRVDRARCSFFYGVLDQRLAGNREHFLR